MSFSHLLRKERILNANNNYGCVCFNRVRPNGKPVNVDGIGWHSNFDPYNAAVPKILIHTSARTPWVQTNILPSEKQIGTPLFIFQETEVYAPIGRGASWPQPLLMWWCQIFKDLGKNRGLLLQLTGSCINTVNNYVCYCILQLGWGCRGWGKILRPEREEVTGSWMKQPSDSWKNESTYRMWLWCGNMKDRDYFEDLVLYGTIIIITYLLHGAESFLSS